MREKDPAAFPGITVNPYLGRSVPCLGMKSARIALRLSIATTIVWIWGVGSNAVEPEGESLAGTHLSGTRDRFLSVAQLVDHARHAVDEGHIHVDPVDETQLTQLISVLDRQYSPRTDAGSPLP